MTLNNIFDCCSSRMTMDTVLTIFYSPLETLISGGHNKMEQIGSSHCLYEFFAYLQRKRETNLLSYILPRYLNLFIVLNQ